MIDFITQVGALALSAIAAWVVMHPRIHEGIVTRLGLACFSVGMLVAGTGACTGRVMATIVLGLLLTVLGVAWRLWRDPVAREAAAHVSGYGSLT